MHRRLPSVLVLASCAVVLASVRGEAAQTDRYKITAAERAACTPDAERLCIDAYPDEDKLMGCMKANRTALSPTCGAAFDAGLKKRGLP